MKDQITDIMKEVPKIPRVILVIVPNEGIFLVDKIKINKPSTRKRPSSMEKYKLNLLIAKNRVK